MSKKILVIGSNSFSGSNFCRYLLDIGFDVFGVSRSNEPDSVFLPYKWGPNCSNFRFYKVDLNHDLEKLEKLIREEKISIIANFAAQSMVGQSWEKPEDWIQTNILALLGLIKILKHLDFIDCYAHVTTPEVYGSTDGWIKEHNCFKPSTPYAVSRASGDMLMQIYRESFNIPYFATRAANVYGAGQQLYRIIPRTILYFLLGKKLQLHGGGVSKRSFISIDDVSRATLMLMERPDFGETFHISTNEIVSIKELVTLISVHMNIDFEKYVEVSEDRIGKDNLYLLNSEKIRKRTGWKESVTLNEGIKNTISWVTKNLAKLKQLPKNYVHKS
ncbi:MAG: dTDP-glucose 4,6-dehydratase [Betaproteobacteria bacterium TMED82]|mgnify:CR=1 FL=1|nr:MAG: dTDP-glucose 4,6-dehydratase [Betaproteobacteria bacterium TMED82]